MKKTMPINRRNFVKASTGIIATIPLLSVNTSSAQELPALTEDDATASALGYKVDASTVDASAYPNYTDTQLCSNCSLYLGKEGDLEGPCGIFPGKSVTAAGWCSVYAPKPA